MNSANHRRRPLSVFTLVMINIIAIDSLRNLPLNAAMGLSVVFFYLLGALFFLLPCALISAELATHWPKTGGAYVWVKEAFGPRWGFLNIWLQWIYNVFWYPTILSFIVSNLFYLIDPALVTHKFFLLSAVITVFLIATVANSFGMKISGLVSSVSALVGTLIPMLFIITLGVVWFIQGKPWAIDSNVRNFFPSLNNLHNISYLIIILFSLMGLEMSAVHAEEVNNPQRDYPRALFFSSVVIVLTLTLSSLIIAVVVPPHLLNLVTGLDQAYELFLTVFRLKGLLPVLLVMIVLGAFGSLSAWIIGPSKALAVAAQDHCAPKIFAKMNKQHVPLPVLILQCLIVLFLCALLIFFKYISTWYWLLSDLTSQLALMFYLILFAAAIRLRYKKTPRSDRAYQIPGGHLGMWCVGLMGILSCIVGIVLGFIPPDNIKIDHLGFYEGFLITGLLLLTLIPFLIAKLQK